MIDNPDAEPVMPCEAAKPAIVVYGKQLGRKLTVCMDKHCPMHDPQAAAEAAAHPVPTMAPAPDVETEEEAAKREAEHKQRMVEYKAEQERKEEERKAEFERQQKEYEAEQTRREEQRKTRAATFECILDNAPATFTAPQLRVLLRALVNLDPYTFADDLADDDGGDNENEQRSAEEVLLSTIDATADDKLTRFALRLALAGHVGIPREGEFDFLTEAEVAFVPPQPKKKAATKKAKQPTPIESTAMATARAKVQKSTSGKKKIAA